MGHTTRATCILCTTYGCGLKPYKIFLAQLCLFGRFCHQAKAKIRMSATWLFHIPQQQKEKKVKILCQISTFFKRALPHKMSGLHITWNNANLSSKIWMVTVSVVLKNRKLRCLLVAWHSHQNIHQFIQRRYSNEDKHNDRWKQTKWLVKRHLQDRSPPVQGCEVLKLAIDDLLEEKVGAILNRRANPKTFTDVKTYRKLNALLMNQLINKSETWRGRET